jgi:hypothetical protein
MERRIPKSGERYRHFKKNKLYQIVTVATHSETGEKLVIYQALYGDFGVYARPLEMFTSEVDHAKYPKATQKYRFELVEGGEEAVTSEETSSAQTAVTSEEKPSAQTAATPTDAIDAGVNPKLMAFFDAEDMETRYNVLVSMRDEVNDVLINNMAVVLDVVIPEGNITDRYEALKQCIRTKQRYEIERP